MRVRVNSNPNKKCQSTLLSCDDFQRQQHFGGKAHQAWLTPTRPDQPSVASFLEVGAASPVSEDEYLGFEALRELYEAARKSRNGDFFFAKDSPSNEGAVKLI